MADRKQELERKKAKLAQMRADREAARKEKDDQEKSIEKKLESVGIAPIQTVVDKLNALEVINETKSLLSDTSDEDVVIETNKKVELSVVFVNTTDIPPKELVQYTKDTQTETSPSSTNYYMTTFEEDISDEEEEFDTKQGSKLPPGMLMVGMPDVSEIKPTEDMSNSKEKQKAIKSLTEEEKLKILKTDGFQKFFNSATKVMEIAITENKTIFDNYNDDIEGEDESQMLKVNRVFCDEKWSKGRVVTSIDWSYKYPELVLASYNSNPQSLHAPEGVCLVWNTKYKKESPECIFQCESPLMTARFSMFHPNIIVGGTYSGQIVLWDNRTNKQNPVQRSRFSGMSHTLPVYCSEVVGSQNANALVTLSTDGKLCTWSLDMLAEPQVVLDLEHKKQSVAPTCLAFKENDANNFLIGSEEGGVYAGAQYGTKAGIQTSFKGHHAPVTGISIHNSLGAVDFSDLFITSSMDWTIKLWSMKERKPICSFDDFGDSIMDCQWSPVHPAIFASADVMGNLQIWNLNYNTNVSTASIKADKESSFNKLKWAHSGLTIAAGNDAGDLCIFDINEKVATPKPDESNRLLSTLQEIRIN